MLRKIIEKLIIVSFIFILHLGSSPSQLLILRIVAFAEKSVIRLQCGKRNKKPFDVRLVSASYVQDKWSLYRFLNLLIHINVSLIEF